MFPYDPSATPKQAGGALYVPTPSRVGRISNPDIHEEFYLSSHAEGAVAEVFAHLPSWHPNDFVHANGCPYAVAQYELDESAAVFDLDDVEALERVGISRPSHVVTRNRNITQAWARSIFAIGSFVGASWWSPYCADWSSYGLWDAAALRFTGDVEPLGVRHSAVAVAAAALVRQVLDR